MVVPQFTETIPGGGEGGNRIASNDVTKYRCTSLHSDNKKKEKKKICGQFAKWHSWFAVGREPSHITDILLSWRSDRPTVKLYQRICTFSMCAFRVLSFAFPALQPIFVQLSAINRRWSFDILLFYKALYLSLVQQAVHFQSKFSTDFSHLETKSTQRNLLVQ